jgi:hypothetical protein
MFDQQPLRLVGGRIKTDRNGDVSEREARKTILAVKQ